MTIPRVARTFDEILQEIQQSRQERLATARDALRWLTVVPVWTPSLAAACSFPPMAAHSASDTLEQIAREGSCLREVPEIVLEGTGEPRFRMNETQRQTAIAESQSGQGSGTDLLRDAPLIADRLRAAAARGVWVPEVDRHWTDLAADAPDPFRMVTTFRDRIDHELREGRPEEAAVWLSAIEPLRHVFGGKVETAVQRALRRIALYERRQNDRAHLEHYLVRDEQVRAYKTLVDARDGVWAIHFIGGAGVGKTMLMRYISAAEFLNVPAAADLPKVRTARVDFDYLNPDYPTRRPALLLVMLAEELRLQDEANAAVHVFTSFFDKAAGIHERVATRSVPDAPAPRKPTDDPEFESLLRLFVEACKLLTLPIVIILDTCEELSRLGANNRLPASIEDTFDILVGLHALMNEQGVVFRVIFCGRRPLASEYHGNVTVAGQERLPARTYIRLHQVTGFSADEANRFFDRERVPKKLRPAILARSRYAGFAIKFVGVADATPASRHFNPFSLSAYSAWVNRHPEITANDILKDPVDHFIRIRILDRMHNDSVRALLPAAAVLGRFDQTMLSATTEIDAAAALELTREITDQEWIDRQAGGFYEVDPELRRRLFDHLRIQQPAALSEAASRAIAFLRSVTLQPDAKEMDTTRLDLAHYDALFRLLPVRDAADWWEQAEMRLAQAGAFQWLRAITDRVLGPSGVLQQPKADAQHPLRAAVLASHAAALAQTELSPENLPFWADANRSSRRHPVPAAVGRLVLRTLCGMVAAQRGRNLLPPSRLGKLTEAARAATPISEPIAASLLAAAERVVENAEWVVGPDQIGAAYFDFVRFVRDTIEAGRFDVTLRTFAASLAGRAELVSMNLDEARVELSRALSLVGASSGDAVPRRGRWSDWVAPADLASRIRVEYLRAMYPCASSADPLLAGVLPPTTVDSADSDRLAATRIFVRRSSGPWQPHFSPHPGGDWYAPTRYVHRCVPPAMLAWAEAEAYAGFVDEFISAARDAASAASRQKLPWLADEVARAMLRVERRMRLRDIALDMTVQLDTSDARDAELVWSAGAFGPVEAVPALGTVDDHAQFSRAAGSPSKRRHRHAWFRTRHALTAKARAELEPEKPWDRIAPRALRESSFTRLSLLLDAVERRLLTGKKPVPLPFDANVWLTANAGRPLEALRLFFRTATLGETAEVSAPRFLVEAIGTYASAVVALDEGELLALRLPARASPLLTAAATLFTESGDAVGPVIAYTTAAMCHARSGRLPHVQAALANVRHAYETLFGDGSWPKLESIASDASKEALDQLQPQGWLPWRTRIIACIAWQADGGQRGDRCLKLANASWPHDDPLVSALPAELYGWLEYPAVQAMRPALVRNTPTPALASVRITGPQANPFPLSSGPYDVQVQWPDQGEFHSNQELNRLFAFEEYHQLGKGMLWVEPFHRRIADATAAPSIEILLDRASSWYPWEALLAPASAPLPRFVRRMATTRRSRPVSGCARFVACLADYFRENIASYGWRKVFRDGRMEASIWSPADFVTTEDIHAQVLHLVGRPIETRSACAIEFIDKRSEALRGSAASVDQERRFLLTAADIAQRNPNLVLCVLQDEVLDWTRTAAERERAKLLKILAAELFASGVPAVVTIPACQAGDTVIPLFSLSEFLIERGEPFGDSLITAIQKGRESLRDPANHPEIDSAVLDELACDLVLYLDDVSWSALPVS